MDIIFVDERNEMAVRDSHAPKAPSSIYAMVSGSLIDCRDVQFAKAYCPMDVIFGGSDIETSDLQA